MNNPKDEKNVKSKSSQFTEYNDLAYKDNNSTAEKSKMTRSQSYNDRFKIILVGDTGVGKTAIVNRFINGNFKKEHNCTIGVEYFVKTLHLGINLVNLLVWDTCGQERFRTITRQYYRDVAGCMLIFDLSKKKSFDHLKNWLKDILDNGIAISTVLLVGNKFDLIEMREVSKEDIDEFVSTNKIKYIEVSAKTGININKSFEEIAKMIIDNKELDSSLKKLKYSPKKSISLGENKNWNEKKKCC